MKLLLDTQSFIWFVRGDSRLSEKVQTRLSEISTEKFLSLASIWEIAIKISINKLKLSKELSVFIKKHQTLNNIRFFRK